MNNYKMSNGKVCVININNSCCKSYKPVLESIIIEPVVEKPIIIEPVVEKVIEPVVEKVIEPVVEKPIIIEPVVEKVIEPIVEKPIIIEPIVEKVIEPIIDENVFLVLDEREKLQDINATTILHEELIGCCSSYTWLKC